MAATDRGMSGGQAGLDSPASSGAAITPDDNNDLAVATRGIYVGGAGAVKVDLLDSGTALTFSGVPAGQTLPIRAKRVYSTGTTATALIALY